MAKKANKKKVANKVTKPAIVRPVTPIDPTKPVEPIDLGNPIRPGVDPAEPPRKDPPDLIRHPRPRPAPKPGPRIGMPAEDELFRQIQAIADSMNKLGESVKEAYNFKQFTVKVAEMPKVKAQLDDGRHGLIHEKWMFNVLKTFSTNLNKVSIAMQKDVQKAVKAKAAAKKGAKKAAKKASKAK